MPSLDAVYPCLAREIIDDYGITSGIAIDVGTGPGHLGIEVARRTDLRVHLLDINPEAVRQAAQNAREAGVADRTVPVVMNVEEMGFPDNFADLVISRGSLWFWDNQSRGLREIQRVLKPGGVARVGGGLSRYLPDETREALVEERKNRMDDPAFARTRSESHCRRIAEEAGLKNYSLRFEDFTGRWIEIRKPATHTPAG